MYISHKYKFVYLRSPKTASSSMAEFFIKNIPDPDAVYTPVEDSRIPGTVDRHLIAKYAANYQFYHFTIQDLVEEGLLSIHQAKTYNVVSVIRDPIDRQKSFLYFYGKWKAGGRPITLEHYKQWAPNGTFKNEPNSAILQSDFLKLYGEYVGTFWPYDNMYYHLIATLHKYNIEPTEQLKQYKSDFRKNRDNEVVFGQEELQKIQSHFAEDFKIYNGVKNA